MHAHTHAHTYTNTHTQAHTHTHTHADKQTWRLTDKEREVKHNFSETTF